MPGRTAGSFTREVNATPQLRLRKTPPLGQIGRGAGIRCTNECTNNDDDDDDNGDGGSVQTGETLFVDPFRECRPSVEQIESLQVATPRSSPSLSDVDRHV